MFVDSWCVVNLCPCGRLCRAFKACLGLSKVKLYAGRKVEMVIESVHQQCVCFVILRNQDHIDQTYVQRVKDHMRNKVVLVTIELDSLEINADI